MRTGAQFVQWHIQKSREKRCFPVVPCLNRPEQPAAKGGEIDLKFFKVIMIVAVLATALSFGACAQHKETVTTGAGTTGYSK